VEVVIVILLIVLIGIVLYSKRDKGSKSFELNKIVKTSDGRVAVNGNLAEFNISVEVSQGDYTYLVKDGNIVGVKIAGSNRYYKYMENE